jgi:hypothetical protein
VLEHFLVGEPLDGGQLGGLGSRPAEQSLCIVTCSPPARARLGARPGLGHHDRRHTAAGTARARRAGLQGQSPARGAPDPARGAPGRLISIKANSVARRAESIPCAWKVRCQLVRVAPYWPEWRSFGTSGLVTGITVTR